MNIAVHPTEQLENDSISIKKEQKRIEKTRVLNLFHKCVSESTFHGIRNLFEPESFVIKRILWLLVIVACTGFCFEQFYVRINRFISNPQTVNVEVIYTNQHEFPQVTVCNNNVFKSTKLISPDSYDVATRIFSETDYTDKEFIQTLDVIDLATYRSTGLYANLTQGYVMSRHDIDDMLHACSFRGQPCNASHFTMIYTDYGPCYQFIGDGNPLVVTSAGIGTGLTLEMNVEQYAYIAGPRYSAGILVLIQDPAEIPLIGGKALAVPVGREVFLGLDLTEIDLLPPPTGNCSNKDLEYYSAYSVASCQLDCLTEYVVTNCGCKIGFMPGNVSLCRITTYFGCAYPYSKNYTQSAFARSCYCPPACTERVYAAAMTSAPMSDFSAMTYALQLKDDYALLQEYISARGILDYHYNIPQRNEDLAVLYQFAPFLAEFSFASVALYLSLQSISELLTAIVQAIPAQSPARSSVMLNAQSIVSITKNVTRVIQSVDPSVYWGSQYLMEVNAISYFFKVYVGIGARIMLFNSFRNDTYQSNNASIFSFLKQTFNESMQQVAQGVQNVVQLINNSGLMVSSPILDAFVQNMSNSLMQLSTTSISFEQSLENMTKFGLPFVNEYIVRSIPITSPLTLDADFVRNNFLKVEIFFKEMRYQQIQKQQSDSVVGLLCDIGGTFGLCLGASIMSVYELIDFFIGYLKIKILYIGSLK